MFGAKGQKEKQKKRTFLFFLLSTKMTQRLDADLAAQKQRQAPPNDDSPFRIFVGGVSFQRHHFRKNLANPSKTPQTPPKPFQVPETVTAEEIGARFSSFGEVTRSLPIFNTTGFIDPGAARGMAFVDVKLKEGCCPNTGCTISNKLQPSSPQN